MIRWNSQKAPVCNLSNAYAEWILLCQTNTQSPNDLWARNLKFLTQGSTYYRVLGLADLLEVYDLDGLKKQQAADSALAGATDLPHSIEYLKASIQGYILARPTEKQRNKEGAEGFHGDQENSIFGRTMKEYLFGEEKWHIQRGMKNIGWKRGEALERMRLRLDPTDADGACINLGITMEVLRDGYMWLKSFATNLVQSLDRRFADQLIWKALAKFTQPAMWRQVEIPREALRTLSQHVDVGHDVLETDWLQLQPLVRAKLGPALPGADVDPFTFRTEILLPTLAPQPHSKLRDLISTAVLSGVNSEELCCRDFDALKSMEAELGPANVGRQCRLHLNEKARASRDGGKARTRTRAQDFVNHILAQRGKRELPVVSKQKTNKRRKFAGHLTEGDKDSLAPSMVAAAEAIAIAPAGGVPSLGPAAHPDMFDDL